MVLSLVQGPMEDVVSLETAKARLKVDTSADDELIRSLVQAATEYLDGSGGLLGRALMPQSWRYDLPAFADEMQLPLPPLIAVEKIEYIDGNNDLQTLATTVYDTVDGGEDRSAVILADSQSWPQTYVGRNDAVRITFMAGYQDLVSPANVPVPAPIVQAILLIAQSMYDRPNEPFPPAVFALVASYRRSKFWIAL